MNDWKLGKKTEERRIFTPEERSQILKDNYGVCARCGKKLDIKNLRVEHVIPLSRGGTNDMVNLTALCETCNTLKGNLFYLPHTFYNHLEGKPRLKELDQYTKEWYHGIGEEMDLERYPLISPSSSIQLYPVAGVIKVRKTRYFSDQLLLNWSLIGDQKSEIEQVSGISIESLKQTLKQITYDGEPAAKKQPAPVYCLRKVTSGKLLAIAGIHYRKAAGRLTVYLPWYQMSKAFVPGMIKNLMVNLLYAIQEVAGETLKSYHVIVPELRDLYTFSEEKLRPMGLGTRITVAGLEENGKERSAALVSLTEEKDANFAIGSMVVRP